MKGFKRTVAWVLAAVLSLSLFLQPVFVSAAAETEESIGNSEKQKTEETGGPEVREIPEEIPAEDPGETLTEEPADANSYTGYCGSECS